MTKTNPDHNVYLRAMGSRVGALQVIIRRRSGEVVSWGSAFVINDSCHVPLALTCNHVVRGKSHRVGDMVFVRKMMPAGVQELNASVVETNPLHDIALLSIPGIRPHTPLPISLTLATVYNVGDCGIAVGYCNPDRLFTEPVCSRLPTVSPGCIREIRHGSAQGGVDNRAVVLDCTCTEGMSGSPVVASNGVIGMCTRIFIDGTHTIAVSSETIIQVLRGWANNGTLNEGLRDLNL